MPKEGARDDASRVCLFPRAGCCDLSPVPRDTRAEVQADLHELFQARRRDRGAVHAHWRLSSRCGESVAPPPAGDARRAAPRRNARAARDIRGDLRYAVRLFARQPGILLLTIVGLSLGLGIATAAFSIMNAAVLRGEGIVDPDRAPGDSPGDRPIVGDRLGYDEFLQLREGSTRMQVEAVLTDGAGCGRPRRKPMRRCATVAFVSGGFFARDWWTG